MRNLSRTKNNPSKVWWIIFFVVPLHPQSRGLHIKHNDGALAQLVEHRTENPCVPGSIPGGTTPPFIMSPCLRVYRAGAFLFPKLKNVRTSVLVIPCLTNIPMRGFPSPPKVFLV